MPPLRKLPQRHLLFRSAWFDSFQTVNLHSFYARKGNLRWCMKLKNWNWSSELQWFQRETITKKSWWQKLNTRIMLWQGRLDHNKNLLQAQQVQMFNRLSQFQTNMFKRQSRACQQRFQTLLAGPGKTKRADLFLCCLQRYAAQNVPCAGGVHQRAWFCFLQS
jgi:hypothetical protein